MKKTISVTVMLQPLTGKYQLDVETFVWDSIYEITEHESIHNETFKTMDEALEKAVSVNYEYEQKEKE